MPTFLELRTAILDISKNHYIQNDSDIQLAFRINNAITEITGGLRLPNGQISSPLPELFSFQIIETNISSAYIPLPDTYQRNVFLVIDENKDKIPPPKGGGYYSFGLFLNRINNQDLSETGDIYIACVKGTNLYYQGIPQSEKNITVFFYRKPVPMISDDDTPDGIPSHLQIRLIKHYIGRQLSFEMVDGTERMANYHNVEFWNAMRDLQDFIGETDATPVYYQSNGLDYTDGGICD